MIEVPLQLILEQYVLTDVWTMLLILAALVIGVWARDNVTWKAAALCGLLLGLAVTFRDQELVMIVPAAIYLATGLSDVGRPDAHDEEADLVVRWFPLDEAMRMVISGEIVNTIAVCGILAAHAVRDDIDSLRPVDADWVDRPTAFARRKEDS